MQKSFRLPPTKKTFGIPVRIREKKNSGPNMRFVGLCVNQSEFRTQERHIIILLVVIMKMAMKLLVLVILSQCKSTVINQPKNTRLRIFTLIVVL